MQPGTTTLLLLRNEDGILGIIFTKVTISVTVAN